VADSVVEQSSLSFAGSLTKSLAPSGLRGSSQSNDDDDALEHSFAEQPLVVQLVVQLAAGKSVGSLLSSSSNNDDGLLDSVVE
jgi:hypothetical protein